MKLVRWLNVFVVLCSMALCANSASAQWLGPTGPKNLIRYTTGNVYVGRAGFDNPVIRFDVVDDGNNSGNVIGIHSFIGTAGNGVRTTAIWGETNNPQGRALQGFNFATTGAGVGGWFETASVDGTAVRGRATSTTGQSFGGKFDNMSVGGVGLFGAASATSGPSIAIWAHSDSATGYGFYSTGGSRNYFEKKIGIGTIPTAQSEMLEVGGNGRISGNLSVTGNVSKAGGTFKIDHPLDPANKYLYHSFVESPDMMNIYNGVVTTDTEGYAVVTMPDYFEAANKDFRYQLTVIDEATPDIFTVRVSQKMRGNTFVIKTFPGNLEVSWQVTGIRNDAWAKANRVKPEVDKGPNRGTYLHPHLFGQPVQKTEGHNPEQSRRAPPTDEAALTPVHSTAAGQTFSPNLR